MVLTHPLDYTDSTDYMYEQNRARERGPWPSDEGIQGAVRGELNMLNPRQGLSEEVRDVDVASDMLHAELPPLDAILQPVKSNVNAFGQARRLQQANMLPYREATPQANTSWPYSHSTATPNQSFSCTRTIKPQSTSRLSPT